MPPRATDCIVQITDNHDWACALFSRNLLRVRRRLRTDVFDAGLHQMPCTIARSHYQAGGSQILRGVASRIAVDVWEARFVKSRKGRWPGSMAPLRSPSTEEPPPSEHPPRRLNWVRSANLARP
jgi:hypothetical protein